jgi:hypothetical protein
MLSISVVDMIGSPIISGKEVDGAMAEAREARTPGPSLQDS